MSSINRKVFFNVPNIVTFSRIALIPVIMLLMLSIGTQQSVRTNQILSWASAILFILAGISDLVDGYYARKYGLVSLVGKFFDPIADKLIHMSVMVLLIPLHRLDAWLVVVILFREILISGLRSIAAGEGVIIAAGDSGKKKTVWFNIGLSALLIYYPFFGINTYSFGLVCVLIGTVFAYISAIQYLFHFFKTLK